ncbi:sigma-70 family RNA polymerase sigma factor [Kiritimatiellaeota bacterium B1221]|nr:sigma-70 family RNA polymerase sigma factor [Kiritimatiellaeota bacterium B1221]
MDEVTRNLMQERRNLVGFLTALTGDRSVADDLFQETCIDALRLKDQFQPGSNFGAWVRSIARIRALRHCRARGKDPLPFSPELMEKLAATWETIMPLTVESDRETALNACIQELQEHHRDVLHRRYARRQSHQCIAKHLNRSVESVKMLTSRLRKRLRLCIERKCTEQETEQTELSS